MLSRAFHTVLVALAALLFAGALVSCGDSSAPSSELLWVKDQYVQCNSFEEPYRECLLVAHAENEFYRHLEGSIDNFDFEEGTKYLLEVIRTDDPISSGEPAYRMIDIISADS